MKKIKNKANKRMWGLVLATAILITVIAMGLNKSSISTSEVETPVLNGPVAEQSASIDLIEIKTQDLKQKIEIQGRIRSENRLEIFPEVQGKIMAFNKPFREGISFNRGEILLQIDSEELRLQLQSSRSGFQTLIASIMPDIKLDYPETFNDFEDWFSKLNPEKNLPSIPKFQHPQLQRFLTARGIYDKYYQIKSVESRLQKFTIKAPFSGVISVAKAESGQSVGPQFHLGTLVDPDSFILEANLHQRYLHGIEMGTEIPVYDQSRTRKWTATLARINPSIDPKTQMISLYLKVEGEELREGMYLEGAFRGNTNMSLARIPKSALLRTGHVYVKVNYRLQQIPVQVVDIERDYIWISGLKDGDEISANAENASSGLILN